MIGLLIYPTHKNLKEEQDRYTAAGIEAEVYPIRSTIETEELSQNCWNKDADQAEQMGFPVGKTICIQCSHHESCLKNGYLADTIRARNAMVSLATHQRAARTGLEELIERRLFVGIHENPLPVLRPDVGISAQDLRTAQEFVQTLVSEPFYLNYFGDGTRINELGERYYDEDQVLRRRRIYEACLVLADLLDHLDAALNQAESNQTWSPQTTIESPPGLESFLWWALCHSKIFFTEAPWQFLLAALNGHLHAAMVIVASRYVKGAPQDSVKLHKSVYGIIKNNPPSGRNIWFCDATAEADLLANLLDGPVFDKTPDGTVPLQQKAVQYQRDITRKTSPRMLVGLIRGLLCKYSDRQRVGIISHSNQLPRLDDLDEEYASRIVMSSYYGSGDERSSNVWHESCDLLLILGTPRIPTETVVEHLIRIGELRAACEPSEWGDIYWHCQTTSGTELKVTGRGYWNPIWRKAHRAIVRAGLVQAIGRGRGILKNGCDVVVLSTEECGLQVVDDSVPYFPDHLWDFYDQLTNLDAKNPINTLYRNVAHNTSEYAKRTGLPERTVQFKLKQLEELGLVHRDGPRSGWKLGPNPSVSHSHTIDSSDSDNRHLNNQSPPSERNL